MSRVRQRGTDIEVVVRQFVADLGHRSRSCVTSLPGSPDLANKTHRWAIFVHGCFWHGHDCPAGNLPKRNRGWWEVKIVANRMRDRKKIGALHKAGYRCLTLWGCEVKIAAENPERLMRELDRFLRPKPRAEYSACRKSR